jgi:hypothetical protein
MGFSRQETIAGKKGRDKTEMEELWGNGGRTFASQIQGSQCEGERSK